VGKAGVNVVRTDQDGRAALPATRLGGRYEEATAASALDDGKGRRRLSRQGDHGHWLVYAKDDHQVPKMPNYLTWDEARRVAKAIARLPELLQRSRAVSWASA
jgi:hypothetical protein